jgi:putative ABC transport system permease protein
MLSRIPVASVFRNFRKSRRAWKLVLLFIQFVATAFLITLLIIVGRQYETMVNDDPGYTYENVIYCSTPGVDETLRQSALDRLSRLPEIASIATCSSLPIDSHSGNNVSLPGDDRELFNIADFYNIDENYLPLLQIPIVEGKGFDKETSIKGHVLVSQSFADRMVDILQWKDGVVGKDLIISEHGLVTVVGVYRDFRLEAIGRDDKRPSVMFYSDTPSHKIVIKLHHLNAENIQRVYDELKAAMPDKDIDVKAYKDSMVKLYTDSRLFRNSVLIGGIVALIIALIGLIGYTNNEMNRRSAEIAIRKINGATLPDLLRLFVKDIIWISLPALILGGVGAAFAARKWMENFTEKVSLTPLFFVLCGLIVLAIILSVVILNCMRVANQNPVDSINND